GANRSTRQVEADFTYRDFINLVNDEYGSNAHQQYTFAIKGKGLNLEDEFSFNQKKKLIVNGANIFVGRRMIGGVNRKSFSKMITILLSKTVVCSLDAFV
ncbi:unnamed protein product, partial [Rotaria sp. Silwood1]